MDLENNLYQIGKWLINCDEQTISCDQHTHKLPTKVFNVLKVLIREQGTTVSKHDLIEEVWQHQEDTGAKGVTNAIWQLRKAFGDENQDEDDDNAASTEVIKTVPKLGYQLVIDAEPVEELGESSQVTQEQQSRPTTKRDIFHRHKINLVVFAIFAGLFAFAKIMLSMQE